MSKSNRRQKFFEQTYEARLAAVQAFYQIEQRDQIPQEVIEEFIQIRFVLEENPIMPDISLFTSLVINAYEHKDKIFHFITESLNENWRYERLEEVLRAILYISSAELLMNTSSIPAPVIISEYVDIAASFYKEKEPKFINGYLDRLARNLDYVMSPPDLENNKDQNLKVQNEEENKD